MLPGTNVSLSVGAVGSGDPIQFQWRLDGQDIPGATNSTYGITNASIAHQGHYTAIATDTNGTAISSNAFLFLFIRPVVVQNPLPQTILQGGTVRFTAIATGAPPIWYRWLSNAVGILTNDTGVLVLTNVQSSHYIRVTATNLASGPFGVAGINVPLTVLADADRDGMADQWETNYPGFSTNNAGDALLDFDGDGLNNREEYIAATDPTDPGSVLRITIGLTNGGVLQFVAQSNIAYSVEYRTNLNSATWNHLTNINGQLQTRVVPIAVPDPRMGEHYYRVVTPPSP
jgi:hypothetical protein